MTIFLVCRSWADGYGYDDCGWEILKAFLAEDAADKYCREQELKKCYGSNDEYYVDILEAS